MWTKNCTKRSESGSAETDINFVQVVWEGKLELPKDRPAGQEIKIKFSYNENQIMNCSFIDVESGEEVKVELSMTDNIKNGSSEIDKFLVEQGVIYGRFNSIRINSFWRMDLKQWYMEEYVIGDFKLGINWQIRCTKSNNEELNLLIFMTSK